MGIWLFAFGLILVPALPLFIPVYIFLILGLMIWLARRIPAAHYCAYFIVGLMINTCQLQHLVDAQLPPSFDHSLQAIDFKIVSIPQQNSLSTVFVAKVKAMHCATSPCPDLIQQRIRLSWYSPKQALLPGQLWSATIKLKRPRGLANPSGFDYQAWLLGQEVMATGYVHSNAKSLGEEWTWSAVRAALAAHLLALAAGNEYARFWTTLLVAESSAVTPADWQTLQATGTVHLMAISGLQIGLVSLWAFWLGRMLAHAWALVSPRSAAAVSHWLPSLISCLMALFYAALAGFSIPTLRAFIACVMVNGCWLLGVRLGPFRLLGAGVAVVAVVEPMVWVNQGFWLSFAAVFLLIYLLSGRLRRTPLRTAFGVQWVLSLGLAVPLLWLGLGVSWTSPFANWVAVPVVSLVVVPGLFAAVLISVVSASLAQSLLLMIDWIFAALWQYLLWLQSWPHPLVWLPKPLAPLTLGLAALGILLLIAPRGLQVRGLGVLAIGLAALLRPEPPPPLRMTVMDVGQGLSVVIQTRTSTWIYDAGPAFSESFDAGSRIIAPYLRAQGISQIGLMVSHADNDHSGGAASLLALFDTHSLLVGEPLPSANSKWPAQQACRQGQKFKLDELSLSVLWPPVHQVVEGNNASCVVLLQMGGPELKQSINILLAGDIDRHVERQLLPLLPPRLEVLVAAHHGSKSSSSPEWVRALKPQRVIFSAGYKNRYHHPHPEVVARFKAAGAETYNTATAGAIILEWWDGAESVITTRQTEVKLWYDRPSAMTAAE